MRPNRKILKILVTESSMNWGGQEERTLRECLWLAGRGHDVKLLGNADSAIVERAAAEGVPTATASLRFAASPRGLTKIWQEATRFEADIINCHSQRDSWMCVPTRLSGIPVVRTQNTNLPDKLSIERSWFYRHGCDHIIATAGSIQKQLVDGLKVPKARVTVIGEGVDTEKFHPRHDGVDFRRQWKIAPDAPLFGVVGMLRGEKGQALFLRAALVAWKRNPALRFVLIGEGVRKNSTEENLRAYVAKEFPAADCPVIFAGFQKDIPQAMAALDVLVVPSTRDAQTLVIPQAFATGRPVIGSNVGGIPDLVQPEKNGLLFPSRDKAALAESMLRLATDASLRKRLGSQARRFAQEHLQTAGKMRELEAVFTRIARQRAAARA